MSKFGRAAAISPHSLPEQFLAELGSPEVSVQKLIASGTSSDVFRSQWQNAAVAAKILKRKNYSYRNEAENRTYREWCVLRQIGAHPHVIQCLGAARTVYCEPCLVLELMSCSLHDRFASLDTDRAFARYLRDVASGMCFLHEHGVLHGALIAKNVLCREGTVKIADFGLAQFASSDDPALPYATNFVEGTEYMPYEVFALHSAEYGLPVDVFSFGVLILACLTRREPTIRLSAARTELDASGTATPIAECRRRATDVRAMSQWHPLRPLVLECWSVGPCRRPVAVDVLSQVEQYVTLLDTNGTHHGVQLKRARK